MYDPLLRYINLWTLNALYKCMTP